MAAVIHDPRVIWVIRDVVNRNKGIYVQSRVGHSFFKEKIRQTNAIYGGEMLAYHYFRDFCYCDSGIIPWLMVLEFMSRQDLPLSQIIRENEDVFPSSGEINFKVSDVQDAFSQIIKTFGPKAIDSDHLDGLTLTFKI